MPRLEARRWERPGHGVHEVVATSQRITVLAGLTLSGPERAWPRVTRNRCTPGSSEFPPRLRRQQCHPGFPVSG